MLMQVGDSSKVTIQPEDGYGLYNQELVHEIPRDQFPPEEKIEPGMTFQTEGPQGPITINVVEVKGDESVTVDLNHPLAGQQLTFDVKIVDIRQPSREEIAELSDGCGCGCGSDGHDSCGPDCGCGAENEEKSGGCGCC
jgi:FKBP-type peptidyl-prolyl cis-trans isomerase SlyD